MKTLFFPFYPNNPYQPNLRKGLAAVGCEVDGIVDISPLSLVKALFDGRKIYHLHWTDPYIMSRRLPASILKAIFFLTFLVLVKIKGGKLIWTIHNFGKHEKHRLKFELFVHRLIAKLADGVITHSRFAKKTVIENYGLQYRSEKVHIIPHGNYIGNYPDDMSRSQARELQNIPENKNVFLFLGQIRQYKGVPELMEVFLKTTSNNEILIVAGRPFDKEAEINLSQLAEKSDNIRLHLGFVEEEKIQEYMQAADVVVFPFRDILTSGSILLAMSFGKAIIVPDLESLEEIIAVGGAITFSREKPDGLQSAIKAALNSDLQALGKRNLEAAKKLSWDSIAAKTARIYSETLS